MAASFDRTSVCVRFVFQRNSVCENLAKKIWDLDEIIA